MTFAFWMVPAGIAVGSVIFLWVVWWMATREPRKVKK